MAADDAVALALVFLLAGAHLAAPVLTFARFVPRSWFLSAAGGVSVAYVFVHLLPEVAEAQQAVEEGATGAVAAVEQHAYLAALLGLVVFYGLERAAVTSRRERAAGGDAPEEAATSPGAFWVSAASFAVYNAIIGYLVVRRAEHESFAELLLFVAAIALHLLINDLGLRHHHRRRYDRRGRPLLVAAVLAGWAVGVTAELSEAAVGVAVAFLAGGVVLNVVKEEVPEERESRFLPLLAGATAYSVILLAV
jgi:hypothetical protein